jgi:hypothetical protein
MIFGRAVSRPQRVDFCAHVDGHLRAVAGDLCRRRVAITSPPFRPFVVINQKGT